MADTPYKSVDPVPREPAEQAALQLSWPSLLLRGPWRRAMVSQDTAVTGRRVVLATQGNGLLEWQVGNLTTGGAAQVYPTATTWRTIAESHAEIMPGQMLELRALAVASGGTDKLDADGVWRQHGPSGNVRLSVDLQSVDSDTATISVEHDIPPTPTVDGFELVDEGSSWTQLEHIYVGSIRPAALTPAEQAKWADNYPTAKLSLAYRGGVRMISANVAEVPDKHVVAAASVSSLHDFPVGAVLPVDKPQTKAPDGATWEEPRYGTQRTLEVAARQQERLGPMILIFGSHAERLAEVTDTDPDPLVISWTSYRSILGDTGHTAWSADAPGWDIPAAYCRISPTNLRSRLRDNAAVVPVRARARARWNSNNNARTAQIQFASSERSVLVLTIPETTTWAWYTLTGYLEAAVTSLDHAAIVQVFARRPSGAGELEVRYLSLQFGAYPVALA